MAKSDHYFHTWCLYVRPSVSTFQNLAKQSGNSDRYWRSVGLAEWIIDDTHD